MQVKLFASLLNTTLILKSNFWHFLSINQKISSADCLLYVNRGGSSPNVYACLHRGGRGSKSPKSCLRLWTAPERTSFSQKSNFQFSDYRNQWLSEIHLTEQGLLTIPPCYEVQMLCRLIFNLGKKLFIWKGV